MNDFVLPRRVALVTGGAGGIGGGIVQALTQRSLDNDSWSDRAIGPTAAKPEIQRRHRASLEFVEGDLADLDNLPRFVDQAFAAFGRIDCLVNNAGVSAAVRGDLLAVSRESYDLNFAVNTRGAFFSHSICL